MLISRLEDCSEEELQLISSMTYAYLHTSNEQNRRKEAIQLQTAEAEQTPPPADKNSLRRGVLSEEAAGGINAFLQREYHHFA